MDDKYYKVIVTFEYDEERLGVSIVQSVIAFDEDDNELENFQQYVGEEFFGSDEDDGPTAEDQARRYFASELDVDPAIIDFDYEGYVPTDE